jgi:hypothetical protein
MRAPSPLAWRLASAVAAAAVLAWPALARADVYKCLGDNSQAVYQDSPCPKGRELRDFQADPGNVSVVPFEQPPPAPPTAPANGKGKRERKAAAPSVERTRGKSAMPRGLASERRFLHTGMSDAEVMARIGPPDIKTGNTDSRSGARWSYLPTDGDPGTITTLHFQSGQVTQIDRTPSR